MLQYTQDMKRRGASLVGVLLVSGVGLVLALALAGSAISHLRLATVLDSRTKARQLAESVAGRAAGELLIDTTNDGVAISTDNQVALLAAGDVAISCPASGARSLRGLSLQPAHRQRRGRRARETPPRSSPPSSSSTSKSSCRPRELLMWRQRT